MIHIRVEDEGVSRRFACGIGPALPVGDTYYFADEAAAIHRADCPGCNPGGPKPYGTPISQLSGRPGEPGYGQFCEIARSWGYD
jgi:hypothetical protein